MTTPNEELRERHVEALRELRVGVDMDAAYDPRAQDKVRALDYAIAAIALRARLRKQCVAWDAYWRGPDAHGVILSPEQATELLADALGVEVKITDGGEREVSFEVWCNDSLEASVTATNEAQAIAEARHYAMQYAEDSPVEIIRTVRYSRVVEMIAAIAGQEERDG